MKEIYVFVPIDTDTVGLNLMDGDGNANPVLLSFNRIDNWGHEGTFVVDLIDEVGEYIDGDSKFIERFDGLDGSATVNLHVGLKDKLYAIDVSIYILEERIYVRVIEE